jgi:hypothetical protein
MNLYILWILIIIFIFFLILFSRYYCYHHPKINIVKKYDYTNKNIALFNPSIVKYKNKYIGLARQSKPTLLASDYMSEIVFSELDENFNAKEWLKLNIPNYLSKNYQYSQYEDPRLFILEDRLFSLQTFVGWYDNKDFNHRYSKMSIVEWDENMNLLGMRIYSEVKGINKNWCLAQYKNKNYMITDFEPFRYFEIDLTNNYELSNKKEIHHHYKGYLGTKVYSIENNKLKCMAHKRYFNKLYYQFRFFEIDLENQNISSISDDMSFTNFDGLFLQYPHFINKIEDKTFITIGIENRLSYLLELKDPDLL